MAWDLAHLPAVRAFLSQLPFWVKSYGFAFPIFNAATFAALRAAMLTGFVETLTEKAYQYEDYETIGHIP